VIKNAEYDFGIKKQNFQQLEERIYEMHQGTRNAKPLEELRKISIFWDNVLEYLKNYSVEGWQQYQQVLAEETGIVQEALLNIITNNNGAKYQNSLRKFIVEKAKECGIIEKPSHKVMSRQRSAEPYTVIDRGQIKHGARKVSGTNKPGSENIFTKKLLGEVR
jgi:hypothetical protein